MNARQIGKDARGRKLYRVPVRVTFNNSSGTIDDWLSPPFVEFDVIAYSPADAANWTAREYESIPETEIIAFGPQGGRTGFVMVNRHTLALWPTPTTKSRLRALGANVYTKRGTIYLDGRAI